MSSAGRAPYMPHGLLDAHAAIVERRRHERDRADGWIGGSRHRGQVGAERGAGNPDRAGAHVRRPAREKGDGGADVLVPRDKRLRVGRQGRARQINGQSADARIGEPLRDHLPVVARTPEHRHKHHGGSGVQVRLEQQARQRAAVGRRERSRPVPAAFTGGCTATNPNTQTPKTPKRQIPTRRTWRRLGVGSWALGVGMEGS